MLADLTLKSTQFYRVKLPPENKINAKIIRFPDNCMTSISSAARQQVPLQESISEMQQPAKIIFFYTASPCFSLLVTIYLSEGLLPLKSMVRVDYI